MKKLWLVVLLSLLGAGCAYVTPYPISVWRAPNGQVAPPEAYDYCQRSAVRGYRVGITNWVGPVGVGNSYGWAEVHPMAFNRCMAGLGLTPLD
jgi:hypothetical protein